VKGYPVLYGRKGDEENKYARNYPGKISAAFLNAREKSCCPTASLHVNLKMEDKSTIRKN